jgi:hypothetical protein
MLSSPSRLEERTAILWMNCFKVALILLLDSSPLTEVTIEFEEYQTQSKDLLKTERIHSSLVVDQTQCYTNFEPHRDITHSLSNLVLAESNHSFGPPLPDKESNLLLRMERGNLRGPRPPWCG